jgi:hypothetical protein
MPDRGTPKKGGINFWKMTVTAQGNLLQKSPGLKKNIGHMTKILIAQAFIHADSIAHSRRKKKSDTMRAAFCNR